MIIELNFQYSKLKCKKIVLMLFSIIYIHKYNQTRKFKLNYILTTENLAIVKIKFSTSAVLNVIPSQFEQIFRIQFHLGNLLILYFVPSRRTWFWKKKLNLNISQTKHIYMCNTYWGPLLQNILKWIFSKNFSTHSTSIRNSDTHKTETGRGWSQWGVDGGWSTRKMHGCLFN